MTEPTHTFKTASFPRVRQLVLDAGWLGKRKNPIHGFIEVDVTLAREAIRAHQERTGEKLSFSAFVAACLGKAVDEDKYVHAYRDWRNRLILFDEVDVLMGMETRVGERTFPLLLPIRAANRRSVLDIHKTVRSMQASPERAVTQYARLIRYYYYLPTLVRRFLYRFVMANPTWRKRYAGTVGLTSVGMFGRGGGWGLASSTWTLNVILGGIAAKPWIVDGEVVTREILHVTVSFDHDIVDGAPAARFTERFKALLEGAEGLPAA